MPPRLRRACRATRRVVLVALVVLAAAWRAAADPLWDAALCNTTTAGEPGELGELAEWSWGACGADARCAERFYISDSHTLHDHTKFLHLFERFVRDHELAREARALALCDARSKLLWLALLRTAHFCTANEVFERGAGCRCRTGKVCHELDAQNYSLNIVTQQVVIVVISAFVVYIGWSLVRALRRATLVWEVVRVAFERARRAQPPVAREINAPG